MTNELSLQCTAFAGPRKLAQGALIDVALAVKTAETREMDAVLVFDDATGRVLDLDLRGTTAEIVARLARPGGAEVEPVRGRGRGRPKLGVVPREVTLLPRHWEWLAQQPGGASGALRRLVDEARRADQGRTERKSAQQRAYTFLFALAGDLPGYEEAIRALFADDGDAFAARMAAWPQDIRDHALMLASGQAAA
ncbi:DUF2239 family protein [Novosphingobium sp. B-7]|uniref:DUF2239 family protein n=1 Tax=Novosphingobium sp. B-7 TaxID=1298855 RepID=UPI0003B3126B|nr:DUF2239 family protein [Novosphingobium sp. B-7]